MQGVVLWDLSMSLLYVLDAVDQLAKHLVQCGNGTPGFLQRHQLAIAISWKRRDTDGPIAPRTTLHRPPLRPA